MNFRLQRRNYTIPEGHYTGPKEMEDVPGMVEMVGKGAGIGALIGGTIGHFREGSNTLSGLWTGGKYGALGGLATKLIINKLHNPMKSVKYQEVDKLIRREFGVYSMSGITVGDSRTKRRTIEEKFSFGDRNVTDYKINIAIYNDSVTMYTLGMTRKELDECSKILDHYCKKYYGMEYVSKAINHKVNSYSVTITFTNYYVINSFIQELSERLGCKINLIENKPLVDRRVSYGALEEEDKFRRDEDEEDYYERRSRDEEERQYSIKDPFLIANTIGYFRMLSSILEDKNSKSPDFVRRKNLTNIYLKDMLKRFHYTEGHDFTLEEDIDSRSMVNKDEVLMSLAGGIFLVTMHKNNTLLGKVDAWYKKNKGKVKKEITKQGLVCYDYEVKTINELEYIIKSFMGTRVKPIIFGLI